MGRHVTTPDPLRTPCDERPPPMSSANDGRLLHGHGGFYGFTALLASAMAVAIFSNAGLGILARFLIDDLGLTRTEIGWLSTAASLTGALLSPAAGKYADRVGGRRTIIAVFAVSAAGYVALGVAPTLGLLFVGALVSGIGQSGGNPSTNKLIGLHIPPGRRGFATGIKQSGVQVAIFLGGIILPTVALAWGWRVALILPGLVALVGLLFAVRFVPNDPPIPPRIRGRAGTKTPIPSGIKWMATDAALNGMIVASLVTYLPLYAEESAGMGIEAAGLVTSVFAFSGFISRIGWAHFAEKTRHFSRPLLLISSISTVGLVLLWMAQSFGPWLVFVGAFVGATGVAFNAVAFLAVIGSVGQHDAGRATGLVGLGFGAGLAGGPPLFGFTVDSTDDYQLGFLLLVAIGVAAAALMIAWGRRDRDRTGRKLS